MKKYALGFLYILLISFSCQFYFAAAADVTVNSGSTVNSIRTTYRPSFKGGSCWQSVIPLVGDTYYFSFEALGFNSSRVDYNCGWSQLIGIWYGNLGVKVDGHEIGNCQMQFGETVSKPPSERKDRIVIFQCPRELAGDTVPEYVRNIPPDKVAGSPKEAKDRFKIFCPKESGDTPTNCDIVKLCGAPREVIEGLKCNAQRCVNQRDDKGDGNFTCRCAQGLVVVKDSENKQVCMPNSCGGGARPNDSNQCTCYKPGTNTADDEKIYDYGSSSCHAKPKTKEECEKIQAVWHPGDENSGLSPRCEVCGERTQVNREKNICEPIGSCPVVPECNQQTQIIQDCKCVQKSPPESCPSGQGRRADNTCGACIAGQKVDTTTGRCVLDTGGTTPAPECRSGLRKANGQCCVSRNFDTNTCTDSDTAQPKPGDACVVQGTGVQGALGADAKTCEVRRCMSDCGQGKHCVNGQCVAQNQTCPQGQMLQNTQCVNDPRAQQQSEEQRCRQEGGEMIQGRCFPKKPNPQQQQQQQKQQPQQQQPQGMTPQQQQQQQQMQAMQECQMRQPQGAWQWNGFQCLPNPNYKPQGYGEQPSITNGVQCNFFGADTIQVPAGEKFTVTYDVAGVKREIKVDTSPKSTTQYTKKEAGDTSTERQATITAPKKKGKLKVSLIVDAVRQNSEACKPIEVQVIDAVPQQDTSSYTSADTGGRETSYTEQQQDTGPRVESISEIIEQNRKTAPSSQQTVKTAPEDDDAYAYLCKTLGIGCAKDLPVESKTPSIRDLQLSSGRPNEITIDPDSEDPADLPNIGEIPGERQQGEQQIATDIGVDGDGKNVVHSAVLDYLGENGQYAPPVGPNSDTSGVLNSSDDEGPAKTEDRVGIFTRIWRWFLNLLGFGPEYVAA